jgi:hypothetical protein
MGLTKLSPPVETPVSVGGRPVSEIEPQCGFQGPWPALLQEGIVQKRFLLSLPSALLRPPPRRQRGDKGRDGRAVGLAEQSGVANDLGHRPAGEIAGWAHAVG